MNNRRILSAGPLCICGAALLMALFWYVQRASQPQPPVAFSGATMGTSYTVKLAGLPADVYLDELRDEVAQTLAGIDGRMSTYRPDSEISRLNRFQRVEWFPVSEETALVIDEALRIGQLTGGAFDVTVGPLVDLWNFGPGDNQGQDGKDQDKTVPTADALSLARSRTGCNNLEVRLSPPAVRKRLAGLRVDLSGVAKGYAVDRVAEHIESRGVTSYMVEVGGEIKTKGHKRSGRPWQIAVESPSDDSRTVQKVIPLTDSAMATSGDYRNYFEKDGVRYSHIIDPRSGYPVSHRMASATVVDASCMRADALATALMVLGPEEGLELAAREELPVLLLMKSDTGFVEEATAEFQRLFP